MDGKKIKIESAENEPKPISIEKRAQEKGKSAELGELFDMMHTLEENLQEKFDIPTTVEDQNAILTNSFVSKALIDIAMRAREFAQSHRNFNVGVAMLGVVNVEKGENPWKILFDANTKDLNNGVVRKCGEQYIMDRMLAENIKQALGFVVVADVQPDDTSEKSAMTLMPCKTCRLAFEEMAKDANSPISASTAVLSVDANDLWIQKAQTVKSLHDFHGESFVENI